MLSPINKSLRMLHKSLGMLAALFLYSSMGNFALADAANSAALPPAEAEALLAAADAIRFPRESFQTEITVANYKDEELDETRLYRVLSKGNENTIVLTVEPAAERGQALLMRGRNLWIYMPAVSQPIRLSLSQRLTGQVANGDLARANFASDYAATWLREDVIDNAEVQVLELSAAAKGVTYDKVHYWIETQTSRPLKAEFFARSGRLLKTMEYRDYKELAGQLRPSRLVIKDALKAGRSSTLSYESMSLRELPDELFTRDYLRRLQ